MITLDPIPKLLISLGAIFIVIGLLWQFGIFAHFRLGRLPGDILIEKENMKFYFPLTTGILISVIISLIAWLFRAK